MLDELQRRNYSQNTVYTYLLIPVTRPSKIPLRSSSEVRSGSAMQIEPGCDRIVKVT
jgi:hypothetical protein